MPEAPKEDMKKTQRTSDEPTETDNWREFYTCIKDSLIWIVSILGLSSVSG